MDRNPKVMDRNPKVEDRNPKVEDKNPKIEDKNPNFFPNKSGEKMPKYLPLLSKSANSISSLFGIP